MLMRSLLAPLVIGLVLSLAAIFAVQWKVVRVTIDEVIEDYVADELVQDAEELFSSLTPLSQGGAVLALQHFDPVFLSPSSGRYYQIVVDGAAILRSASLVDQVLPVRPVAPGQRALTRVSGPQAQELLLSASGYQRDGRRITIAVAADMKPVRTEFDRLSMRYTQVSALMFVLLLCLQVAIVRLALAPLRRMRADVSRLERGEIVQLSERVPAEVLPLVREVNRLLALLSQRLNRSRESLGNLAHALKAPLTVLTHIAGDTHVRRDPALAVQMDEQLALLRSRIESELRRARVAGGRAPGGSLDLAAEIGSLASTLRKIYRERDLEIECRIAPGVQFIGDREDLLELIGNLLDNACKWARARVRVSAGVEHGLVVTIEDDGPGCPPEELSRIAGRGVRIDEGTAGHGLGLAIAKGIAATYGAQLRLGRSAELGGFEAAVAFPVA